MNRQDAKGAKTGERRGRELTTESTEDTERKAERGEEKK
jgi:hypothetical protein